MRHDAFVRGDDEQGGIDTADAGQHILDMKSRWPGTSTMPTVSPSGKSNQAKAQVNGHAAGLLFGEPVRIDSAQFFDESGFAVVDMPGGADDAH